MNTPGRAVTPWRRLPAVLPALRLWHCTVMTLAMIAAAVAAALLTPDLHAVGGTPRLDAAVPAAFGDWTRVEQPQVPIDVVAGDGRGTLQRPYDEVVMRTYQNSRGERIMLALAYGREQRQDVKVHRPELCYVAAGFQIVSTEGTTFGRLQGAHAEVRGKRLYAAGPQGNEAVSYWIRIGDVYTDSGWDIRRHIFGQGLQGKIPDGVLVRASRRVDGPRDAAAAWPQLEAFLEALTEATPAQARAFLVR